MDEVDRGDGGLCEALGSGRLTGLDSKGEAIRSPHQEHTKQLEGAVEFKLNLGLEFCLGGMRKPYHILRSFRLRFFCSAGIWV